MAKGWKRYAESTLARSGVAHGIRSLAEPTTAILAYHNVVPYGESPVGDLSLHIDQDVFGTHLDRILETHDVVPLADLLQPESPRTGRPRAVITFDDAYQGALTAGVEELRKRDLPSTMFVSPGLLSAEGFWWDLLSPGSGSTLAPDVRALALDELRGVHADVLAWATREGLPRISLPDFARPSDEGMLADPSRFPRMVFGSHTWSHVNLALTTTEETRSEVLRTRSWLATSGLPTVDWLAYPYGLYSEDAVAFVAAHTDGALRVDGGLAERRGHVRGARHRFPRVNVPRNLTVDGLCLRLCGLR